jgi:hypothetical protein
MQPKHSGYPTKQPGFFSSNQVGFNTKSFAGSAEIPEPMMAGRLWKMYRGDDK